jgi:hypothetical protein
VRRSIQPSGTYVTYLNTAVAVFRELSGQELVQFSLEQTVSDELQGKKGK